MISRGCGAEIRTPSANASSARAPPAGMPARASSGPRRRVCGDPPPVDSPSPTGQERDRHRVVDGVGHPRASNETDDYLGMLRPDAGVVQPPRPSGSWPASRSLVTMSSLDTRDGIASLTRSRCKQVVSSRRNLAASACNSAARRRDPTCKDLNDLHPTAPACITEPTPRHRASNLRVGGSSPSGRASTSGEIPRACAW